MLQLVAKTSGRGVLTTPDTNAFQENMDSGSKEMKAFKHEPRRVKWKSWLLWVKIRIVRTKIQKQELTCTLWSSLGPGHYCCATKHDCTGLQFDPAFQCSCVWLGSSIAKFECRDTAAYRAHTGHSPLHTASYCFTGRVARLPSHTPESDCQIACRQKIANSEKRWKKLMWTWTPRPRHITTQHICQ